MARQELQAPTEQKIEWRRYLASSALHERLSLVIDIYRNLHRNSGKDATKAKVWLRSPNNDPAFRGHAPIGFIDSGTVLGLLHVSRCLQDTSQSKKNKGVQERQSGLRRKRVTPHDRDT